MKRKPAGAGWTGPLTYWFNPSADQKIIISTTTTDYLKENWLRVQKKKNLKPTSLPNQHFTVSFPQKSQRSSCAFTKAQLPSVNACPTSLQRGGEPLLPSVHGEVSPQVAAWYKRLAAVRTPELFAVRVDCHVDLQGSWLGEAFATVDAAVAFLSGVNALVAFQVAGVGEALAAQRADERLLACVDPHVGLQVLQAGQGFTAAVTDKRLATSVVSAVVGNSVRPSLVPPPVPSRENILSLRRPFPHWRLGLVGSQRRPLLAVCERCGLLVLCCCRQIHLADREGEAVAAWISRNTHTIVQRVGAAGIFTQETLVSAGPALQRGLVHQTVVTAGFWPLAGGQSFLHRRGGGAAHPGPRRAVVFVCFGFLFGQRGWSFCVCGLCFTNRTKTFCNWNRTQKIML